MPRRIAPGWRYTLAQTVLRLLFGRRWHFISPWPQAGPGAGVVIFWNGTVLLHQRRGSIERAGAWGCNGGYLDLTRHETFPQGLARELLEETGLQVVPESFGAPIWIDLFYGQEKIEMASHTGVGCWYAVQAPQDLLPLVQETTEAHHYRWVSEAEIAAMHRAGQLASAETHEALRRAFAAAKAGLLPILQLR